MNSKAIKRQLLAAIAMVLVAAIALGSSTYAWFANNNKVSATGMAVQATAEGGIQIKAVSGTQTVTASQDWATVADAKVASTTLYPTSNNPKATNGVLTSDWYHASAEKSTNSEARKDTYAKLQSVEGECTFTNGVAAGNGVLAYEAGKSGALTAGAYYLATTYNIAYTGTSATDLKVESVEVTGVKNQDFDQSLRVAVVCGSNVALYAPVGYTSGSKASYNVISATTGTPVETATSTGTTSVTALAKDEVSTAIEQTVGSTDKPTVVNIYVWFEGEDGHHYTTNLGTNIDNLNVTVNFSASIATQR